MREYVDSIIINDADPRIRCLWQAITQQNEAFLDRLSRVRVSVAEWRRQREIYERRDLRRILELGFATFFLNRTSRSGIVHNGGPIGGFDQSGNYGIDARFNRAQLARRIQRIGAYADRITVSGEDGLGLLRTLNGKPSFAKRSFVYIDPPYYVKGSELYLNRFTSDQHTALALYLSDARRFPWVMTYDNVPEIRRLYRGLPQVKFYLSYSAYERRTGEELLIHPARIVVPRTAINALPAVA